MSVTKYITIQQAMELIIETADESFRDGAAGTIEDLRAALKEVEARGMPITYADIYYVLDGFPAQMKLADNLIAELKKKAVEKLN